MWNLALVSRNKKIMDLEEDEHGVSGQEKEGGELLGFSVPTVVLRSVESKPLFHSPAPCMSVENQQEAKILLQPPPHKV